MKVVYVGDLPNGSVDFRGATMNFKKGQPLEVSEDLAAALLKTPVWQEAKKGGK